MRLVVLVVCLVCAMVALGKVVQKRDVHHRIILHERRPRPHHKHHYHETRTRGKREKQKHKYKGKGHDHDFSVEDYSKYYDSRENSYEEVRHKPYHNHFHHKVPKRPHFSSMEYDEVKPEFHQGEWTPLFSSETSSNFHQSSSDYPHSASRRRPRKERKRYSSILNVDLTTKYPPSTPYYPGFTNYGSFSQKNIDLKPASFLRSAKYKALKNDTSYEVFENHKDHYEDLLEDQNFQVLAPMLALTGKDLAAEANTRKRAVKSGRDLEDPPKHHSRNRGRRFKMKN